VEFEPTVSQSPLVRPRGQSSDPSAIQNPAPARNFPELEPTPAIPDEALNRNDETGNNQGPAFGKLIFGLALMLIGGALFFIHFARDRSSRVGRWWEKVSRSLTEPLPVQVDHSIRRLGITPPNFLRQWATQALLSPLGRAYQEVNKALDRLRKAPPIDATPAERAVALAQALPEAAKPAQKLLKEYEFGTYSTHPVDVNAAQQAGSEIRRLSNAARFRSWFSWLFSKSVKK
jgi:hypothetical protein